MLKSQLVLFCCAVIALASVAGGSLDSVRSESITDAMETAQDNDLTKPFFKNLQKGFAMPISSAEELLLREYGAIFIARNGVKPPTKIVFEDDADVDAFQGSLKTDSEVIRGIKVELQKEALEALDDARKEASKQGLSISPRSSDSSRRDYKHTVDLWASRVNPGLAYWTAKGKITKTDATRIKKLSPFAQVPEILELEQKKIYFAKSLDKSIIYSVAPPGTSQHLSMLALDVAEFDNAAVRDVLAKHGWFQTVTSDLPHFTYLGVKEEKLPTLGLRKVVNSGRVFWVPDVD
jgi:hypothetical protein